jgi:hypothetical protein
LALENLKNLSPKLFNDRVKKIKNTPQHAPGGKRVISPGIQHLTGHSIFDNIGYVAAFDRIFRPHFNGGFRTLYSPDESRLSNIVSSINSDITSFNSILDNGLFRSSAYNIPIRSNNSPLQNQSDSTTADNPTLDGIPDINQSLIANQYFSVGLGINVEFNNPLSVDNKLNPHFNSQFDDGVGGLFNQTEDYSNVFRTINTPKGYGDSPDGNAIVSRGNISPKDGTSPGTGYPNKRDLLKLYSESRNIGQSPTPYINSTSTEEGSIDLSGTWYYGGQQTSHIPFLNLFVEGSTDGTGTRVFPEAATEKRKVPLNYNITGQTIRSMDQHTLLFGAKFEQRVTENKKIEVVGQQLSLQHAAYNSGFRTSIFKSPKGSGKFLSDIGLFIGGNNQTGGEPYFIYSNDPKEMAGSKLGRELPFNAMARDVVRFMKFQTSMAGLLFLGRQNLLGLTARSNPKMTPDVTIFAPGAPNRELFMAGGGFSKMLPLQQKFRAFYNPISTLAQIVTNGIVGYGGSSFYHFERDWPVMPDLTGLSAPDGSYKDYMTNSSELWEDKLWYRNQRNNKFVNDRVGTKYLNNVNTSMDPRGNRGPLKGFGDFMTLMELNKASTNRKTLSQAHPNDSEKIEAVQAGMPFYFYDMRTNQYLIFRGYLEGISENVTADWNTDKYVGRSEPVYSYTGGERDISFSLKIYAHTKFELNAMYKKLNHLTSLCYPQYVNDSSRGYSTALTRMKPPLTKLRLGELYGSAKVEMGSKASTKFADVVTNKDLTGFIKSLSYSVPDESPWEISHGKRVPKYITVEISYQVIHDSTPDVNTKFYGFTGYNTSNATGKDSRENGAGQYFNDEGDSIPNPIIEW